RTPPGPEGSNGKATLSCAVGVPGRSRLGGEIAGRHVRGRVHGHSSHRGHGARPPNPRVRVAPRLCRGGPSGRRVRPSAVSDCQVLARKWRPQTFEAVVGQDAITRTVRNALASGRIAHAYLFAGPRGVGKTTTARLLARALLCPERSGAEPCGACVACRE